MYIAELKGKLSSKIEHSEDVLTSNVFSFFKYSNRKAYLQKFMQLIDIEANEKELKKADFVFWPTYENNTEPDLVIIVGDYYILVEAKYFSDFGDAVELDKKQLNREISGGLIEAKNYNKEFKMVAITAHYNLPKHKFLDVPARYRNMVTWTNWQAIAKILLNELESKQEKASDFQFSKDLYDLLDKKKLRGFISFSRIKNQHAVSFVENVFFEAHTAKYRGNYIGFWQALSKIGKVPKPKGNIFFGKEYFNHFPKISIKENKKIFWEIQDG